VFLASIGALSLMLLTGYAGQISLGHAGLIAAGAFITGILTQEIHAPFWLTLPASAFTGIVLGLIFGLPSLRLRGLYLAVSTLALHFVVIYLGGEYETKRGFSTGILIDTPSLFGWKLSGGRAWYFVLLAFAAAALLGSINLLRSRSGRAWRAIHARETVAEALGIGIAQYKLLAFVISSGMTAVAGCLFAYYRGFVSIEAFDLFLSIQYVAMIIIGGMGSLLGALLGAAFVTVFPYAIEALLGLLPNARALAGDIFAVNYAAFGVVMILFLLLEPLGLVGIWRRVQNYFLLWPFKYRPLTGTRK
jgi:branched-chain amino acid transport system permease protein